MVMTSHCRENSTNNLAFKIPPTYYSSMTKRENQVALIRKHSRPAAPLRPDLPPPFASLLDKPLPRRPRAYLLDVYGTLFTSASGDISLAGNQDRAAAVAAAFSCCGLDAPGKKDTQTLSREFRSAIEAAHAELRERGVECPEIDVRAIWQRAFSAAETALPAELVEDFALCYELHANPVWPMPQADHLLAGLRTRNLPMGIVSNAQFYTPQLFPALLGGTLRELGFRSEFCAFSFEYGSAKPGSALFAPPLAALAALGIDSSQVVYVGNDMLNDIVAAHRAGCMTVLYAGDRRSLRLREDNKGAQAVLPNSVVRALARVLTVSES